VKSALILLILSDLNCGILILIGVMLDEIIFKLYLRALLHYLVQVRT